MTTDGSPEDAARAASRRSWPTLLAAGACVGIILWMGLGWDALTRPGSYTGRKNDYYSSLVHGFLSGHLYMDKVPDPGLDSPDPKVVLNAAKVLDASYYKGHFYLYFGATPAALVLLPYAWLTGSDLDPRFVAVLAVALGFLFALGTWLMFRRDSLAGLGGWFPPAAAVALAFATPTALLLTRAMFYEVAIAAGYACSMAGAFWLYRALAGRGRPALQLALASLCLGLGVGCRPDLVLAVPVLAAAALLLAWRGRGSRPAPRALIRPGAAAVLPAALVGAGLAAYNLGRFGNPLDFGFKYSQNKFFSLHDPFARADFLWTNLRWDFLTLPSLGPYFPYVFPENATFRPRGFHGDEAIHGQFPVFALVAFVALSALLLRGRLRPGRSGAYLVLVGWLFLAPFLALSFLGLRADRYLVDFEPALTLAAVLVAGLVAAGIASGARRRLWVGAFCLLTAAAAAFNIFAGLEQFDAFKDLRGPAYRALERAGNVPSRWLQELGLLRSGPLELRVVFPGDVATARIEPLVTLGTPERSDSLNVIEIPGNQVQFVADHSRYGGPRSAVLPITPGRAYTLKVDMGALYPPLNHPFFAGYSRAQARQEKAVLRVTMDGAEAMDERMNSYDAPPWTLELGRNDTTYTLFERRFTGSILSMQRLPPAPPPAGQTDGGLWRIRCVFPVSDPGTGLPLLSMGLRDSCTLVSAAVVAPGRIRLGVDEWSMPLQSSEAIGIDAGREHTIEVFIGKLAGKTTWPAAWGISTRNLRDSGNELRVWMDGKQRLVARINLGLDPLDSYIRVGQNVQGFTHAVPVFEGSIRPDPFGPDEARRFLAKNVGSEANPDPSLWRFRCTFPAGQPNGGFPILSAGVPGSGTLVYARVLPGGQVRIGVDEWSIGGALSDPLRVSGQTEHVLEVFLGPLAKRRPWPGDWGLEQGRLNGSGGVLRVWLDGAQVLETNIHGFFGPPGSPFGVGANPQGFSTAGPVYPGRILSDPYSGDESREFLLRNLR